LKVDTKATAQLDVLEAVHGVVEEASKGDDANSKATYFHGDSYLKSVRT
jgi:hypothetical protein